MIRNRYRRILWFFARVLLDVGFWDMFLPRLGLRGLGRRSRRQRLTGYAVRFRALAVQMGGVMIKVGQFLSARLDVLPREITDELAGLQDEVSPEQFADIRRVAEAEFGAPLESKFAWFDPVPLAAASIGQVHCARIELPPAAADQPARMVDAVVKVQRPNIAGIVATDLAALNVVGRWVENLAVVRKHVNMRALLEEFSRSLYEEIDYLHEGKNAETFAANFASRPDIRVPQVYWSHTTLRVLTLEDVRAIKITDYAAIEAAGVSRAEVAARLFDTYLQQIFEDRFFHADPHPGNLFVEPLEPAAEGQPRPWRLVFIDFGMTGVIPDNLLDGMREMLIAVATQDAARVIKAYQMLDILLPGADLTLLEKAGTRVFERFWGKTTPEMMNMHQEEAVAFINEFGDLLYEMPFQLPENFILLGRSLAILSGMCSGLDLNFNIWTSIAPYARKLVEAEGRRGFDYWLKEAGGYLGTLAGLPRRADALLARAESGRLEVLSPNLTRQVERLEKTQRKTAGAVIFAGLLLGAVQLYLGGAVGLAAGMGAAALLALAWVVVK